MNNPQKKPKWIFKIFKTTKITEPCYGIYIFTEETKKWRKEMFWYTGSGVKRRYKVTIEYEEIK